MSLQVQTRTSGNVAILQCNGRIVLGPATATLDAEVRKYFSEFYDVVLDLSGVTHVDSSGLGLLVRLICATRSSKVKMRLCSAPPALQRLITLTNLASILPTYDSASGAIRALSKTAPTPSKPGKLAFILCVHESLDVLACLRESLGRDGYEIQTASRVPDALILAKARTPDLLIASSSLVSRLAGMAREREIRVLELDHDFAAQDPAEALASLGSRICNSLGTSH